MGKHSATYNVGMNSRILGAILILALGVTAAAAQRPVHTEMLVSTEWLANYLNDPNLVVLHVALNPDDYKAGHIPGARFVAMADLVVTRAGVPNELPPVDELKSLFESLGVGDKTRVVLYGDMLGLHAARAWFTLDYLGHGKRAALLNGGLEKWRAEGRPVSTEPAPAPAKVTFTPHVRPWALIEHAMLGWDASSVSSGLALIDARPPEQFLVPQVDAVEIADGRRSRSRREESGGTGHHLHPTFPGLLILLPWRMLPHRSATAMTCLKV